MKRKSLILTTIFSVAFLSIALWATYKVWLIVWADGVGQDGRLLSALTYVFFEQAEGKYPDSISEVAKYWEHDHSQNVSNEPLQNRLNTDLRAWELRVIEDEHKDVPSLIFDPSHSKSLYPFGKRGEIMVFSPKGGGRWRRKDLVLPSEF